MVKETRRVGFKETYKGAFGDDTFEWRDKQKHISSHMDLRGGGCEHDGAGGQPD